MKNRNPVIAFVLSLFISGLGQVYNGELKKGIFFLVIIFPIYLLVGLTGIVSEFTGMLLIVSIILLYKLLVCIEAFRSAKRLNPYQLKSINKNWNYVLFAIVGYAIILIATKINKDLIGYEAFEISTSSMEPTIYVGDKVMATKLNKDDIQLGDVVTFTREDGQKYICRVLGLPNQQISIENDKVTYSENSEQWVKTNVSNDFDFEYQEFESKLPNGIKFKTKQIIKYKGMEIPKQEISNIAVQTVPSDNIFVMGDNRNNSMDSRLYGTINLSQIGKKVNYIWWSKTKERIGIKLND